MEGPYRLINTILAHDGPIRCISRGPTDSEVITGCQSDAPHVRRWRLSPDFLSVEEIGEPIYHDHWVTAVTSLLPNPTRNVFPEGCVITGCMDNHIRLFDVNGILITTLRGHSKGVISFSWTTDNYLISGSWDGTAKVWDLASCQEVKSFGPHENGVHVLGLSNGLIATTSTGESIDGRPAHFRLRFWDPVTGNTVGSAIEDHLGSIRSIASLPGMDGILTTSNDGTVVMRSIDGQSIEILAHPVQEDGSPPFVLDCSAIPSENGMDFVSGAEDGSVVAWSGGEQVQSIPHPNTVWTVYGVADGIFVTGAYDGCLRIFSNDLSYHTHEGVIRLTSDFVTEVLEAKRKKVTGPSADEIAKAPKWDDRLQNPGKSENQVMVFNKDNQLIAAQWNSGSWVVIGEVTGTGDGGYLNGVWFDHVFPVEVETSQGLKTLKLGYNNQENPFVAAQRFINEHGLQQNYLSQIADWIMTRTGKPAPTIGNVPSSFVDFTKMNAPNPAIGGGAGHSANAAVAIPSTPVFTSGIQGYVVFDEAPNHTKMLAKIQEFSQLKYQLNETQLQVIDTTLQVLSNTSHYHSSEIPSLFFSVLTTSLLKWAPEHAFVIYDILRLIALHPQGSEALGSSKLQLTLQQIIDQTLTLVNSLEVNSNAYAVLITAARFLANGFKSESLRRSLITLPNGRNGLSLLEAILQHNLHSNKLVRTAVVSAAYNYVASVVIFKHGQMEPYILEHILNSCYNNIKLEQDQAIVAYRAIQMVGSLASSVYHQHVKSTSQVCGGVAILKDCEKHWSTKSNNEELVRAAKELATIFS